MSEAAQAIKQNPWRVTSNSATSQDGRYLISWRETSVGLFYNGFVKDSGLWHNLPGAAGHDKDTVKAACVKHAKDNP